MTPTPSIPAGPAAGVLPTETTGTPTPTDDQAPDYSQGYVICIAVRADGTFRVRQEPLEEETAEDQGQPETPGESAPDIAQALKQAALIYRANPVGEGEGTEQANFAAHAMPDTAT